jgi:acyl-CoA synthetase (AMP-forming)/AMP-acid ligase II
MAAQLIAADWLRASAQANPEALALSYDDRRVTYQELDRLVTNLAGYLRSRGVQPGEHVGALLPNACPMWRSSMPSYDWEQPWCPLTTA